MSLFPKKVEYLFNRLETIPTIRLDWVMEHG